VRQALGTVDFKPTILALMGIADSAPNEGRDASALFRDGRAPAGWQDVAFVRIGGVAQRARSADDDEEGGAGWFGAFSRRYKFVVAPNSSPSLFDLENDPDELTNLFTAPGERETVRRLASDLTTYAKRFDDPHFASSRVKSDLAWAVSPETHYTAPAGAEPVKQPVASKKKRKQ
jgi:arylsulfatase A-like enzyme